MDHSVRGYLERQKTDKLLKLVQDHFGENVLAVQMECVRDAVEILLLRGERLSPDVLRWYVEMRNCE